MGRNTVDNGTRIGRPFALLDFDHHILARSATNAVFYVFGH